MFKEMGIGKLVGKKTNMTEEEKDLRIKELEQFILEYIIDNVYYYGSPLWDKGMELLNLKEDE